MSKHDWRDWQDPHMWGRYFAPDVITTKPLRVPRYECIGDESADTYPAILRALKYRAVEKHLRED